MGVICGYVAIIALGIALTTIVISVWTNHFAYKQNTLKASVNIDSSSSGINIVTQNIDDVIAKINQVDTLAINAAFLSKMRENGELLSSDEFASRITDYYSTLVAVLTSLFVLFTLVTYMTIKNQFEGKFDEKARELENNQRQKIVDELRSMLSDSKKIDEIIQSTIGGHIDDKIATKEEIEHLSQVIDNQGRNVISLMSSYMEMKKSNNELIKAVLDLQEQVADNTTVCDDIVGTNTSSDAEVDKTSEDGNASIIDKKD